jgi:hypothetical protein
LLEEENPQNQMAAVVAAWKLDPSGPPPIDLLQNTFHRKTLWMAAWSVGLTSSSSMFTCGGRLATQTSVSAMSSAVSGWMPS